jgi:hypothetical protein
VVIKEMTIVIRGVELDHRSTLLAGCWRDAEHEAPNKHGVEAPMNRASGKSTLGRQLALTAVFIVGLAITISFFIASFHHIYAEERLSEGDVAPLTVPIGTLSTLLADKGELKNLPGLVGDQNRDLLAQLSEIKGLDPSSDLTAKRVGIVSANLQLFQRELETRVQRGSDAVTKLDAELKVLKRKVGTSTPFGSGYRAFFGEVTTLFVASVWPIAVVVAFFFMAASPLSLTEFLKSFRSVEIGGAKLVMNSGEEERAKTEGLLAQYRSGAALKFDAWVDDSDIRAQLNKVLTKILKGHPKGFKYRATIHVRDIVFQDTFYQLLDYLPKGDKRGRIFSVRFGITGRAWRLGETQSENNLKIEALDLIRDWGMTSEEASRQAQGTLSFLCVPLLDDSKRLLGVFYMDSPTPIVVAPATEGVWQDNVRESCQTFGIIKMLSQLREELKGAGPRIRVYES